MLLRASSELEGEGANIESIVQNVHSNVQAGAELTAFAEAVVQGDEQHITSTRTAVSKTLGDLAMVDAAAVIANFQRMVRIADSTGIPLDEPVMMMTQSIRKQLGLDSYAASANSPRLPLIKRILGRVLAPIAPRLLQRMARRRSANSS